MSTEEEKEWKFGNYLYLAFYIIYVLLGIGVISWIIWLTFEDSLAIFISLLIADLTFISMLILLLYVAFYGYFHSKKETIQEEKEILPSKLPLLSKKFDYQATAEESELKIDTTYFDIGSLEDLEKKEEKKK